MHLRVRQPLHGIVTRGKIAPKMSARVKIRGTGRSTEKIEVSPVVPAVVPYTIHVPDAALADLKSRLAHARLAVMPTGFTQDTWVTSIQIKPEYPGVTHHICTGYVPHQPGVKYGLGVWADKPRDGNAL
jgi:hypothetical protein